MPLQGSLSIERMGQLAEVSRAGFYRSLQEKRPAEEDMEVRSAIQEIAVEHRRRYGYRRISAELRRQGMLVNHKRVLRIIREDNLLAVQPRGFVVTTDSDHKFEVYLNLAGRMKMTGNGIGSTRCCRCRRAGRNGMASSTLATARFRYMRPWM
jgi:putative transposase